MRRAVKILTTLALTFAVICAMEKNSQAMPEGFVYVSDTVIPGVVCDIRYYGTNNFVGGRVDSYNAPEAILTTAAARALRQASDILGKKGYAIKIFDAYRPASAVAHFVRWAADLGDTKMKEVFYPDIDKSELFKRGYISKRSGHSRGSTVDLTLTDAKTGREVDMGSPFDFFGAVSAPDSGLVTDKQRSNRRILRDAMTSCGFAPIATEWWHFTLKNEPYPKEYFDFKIENSVVRRGGVNIPQSAGKLVAVRAAGTRAVVCALVRDGGGWMETARGEGFVGGSGASPKKKEGDGHTPLGVYSFGPAFGVADNPGSAKPYLKLAPDDVWVDDPNSKYYNRLVKDGLPDKDWKSAERLSSETDAYKYAIAVNYNAEPVVRGAGSAIFLHCSKGRPTAGCVAVDEEYMKKLLAFVDDGTMIVIAE
jgi:D-alanyl-D-alanine dipeptidase/L,D-peptidoglycan transpeptidase YkuD (ErfK/YbiS/YcfS/YnhG family)